MAVRRELDGSVALKIVSILPLENPTFKPEFTGTNAKLIRVNPEIASDYVVIMRRTIDLAGK